ncbi:hypothetical protein ABIE09_001770 [Lysobacter enzymogenes]|uniref:hypothetical protein n=1 Tax=Lysobacter enzymogenes TaxID=69 RepID=UPI0033966044
MKLCRYFALVLCAGLLLCAGCEVPHRPPLLDDGAKAAGAKAAQALAETSLPNHSYQK